MREERREGEGGGQEGKRENSERCRREEEWRERGGREAVWEELEEDNRERWGGTGYATFLLTTASNQSKGKHGTSCANENTAYKYTLLISFYVKQDLKRWIITYK